MNRLRKISTKILLITIIGLIAGCSGAKKVVEQTENPNRDEALQHFLQGSVLDQKGEYAQAVLEYQDALRLMQDAAICHAIAKDYAILGKLDLAIQNGKDAVRLNPDNRTYRQTLAEIYLNAADVANSTKEYEELVKIDPQYRDGWQSLAHVQQLVNPEKALETYRQVVERFGPDEDAYYQIAHIYAALKKPDQAIVALRGLLEMDPGNFEVQKAIGDMYLQQDSVEAALTIYKQLTELHPQQLELLGALAHAYLAAHDYEKAAQQFDVVLKKDSVSADDQIRFGQMFLAFIEKDSAVLPYALKMFEKIQTAYPSDWRSYWFLGALYNLKQDDSTALAYFGKVTEMAKWNPDGWISTASIYYDRNRFDEAVKVLTEAQRFVQDEFRVYFLLGVSHQRLHQTIDAASTLEKAVQLNDKSVEALSALGMVYDEMKRYEDSDSTYERALRLDPKNHLLLNNFGYSLAERGIQLERALAMSKQAVALQPTNQSYLDTYGWIYYRLGDYKEAEIYIRRAIELGSQSAVINDHMGDIYFRLSEQENAIKFWQKALELDPENQKLKEKVQRGSL
jgi:tetratricopeptide (TPR) repeat protein